MLKRLFLFGINMLSMLSMLRLVQPEANRLFFWLGGSTY